MATHRYLINQFDVESELDLPCDSADGASRRGTERLVIERCPMGLPEEFPEVHWIGRRGALRAYSVGSGLLVCADRSLQLHVDHTGTRIGIAFDSVDEWAVAAARACAVNLAMSICTLMRGDLPLHGASVGLDGRRIVVLAPSGTGKSTLLWRLLDSGARLANDDVTPIRQADGQVLSWSAGGLHAKLSRAALEACALDPAAYRPWLPDAQEFWVPVEPARQAEATGPLAAIFALHPLPEPPPFAPVMARRQFAGAAVGHLMANTQGLWAAYTEIDARHLLQTYTAIARSVPVYVLEYYRCFEILPALERTICELVEASADEPMAAEPSEVRNRRRSRPNAWHAVLDRLRDAPRLRRSGSRVTPVP